MRYIARVGEEQLTVGLDENGQQRHVSLGERDLSVDWRQIGEAEAGGGVGQEHAGRYSALIGTRSYDVFVRQLPDDPEATTGGARTFEVSVGGIPYRVTLEDERTRALASRAGAGHVSGDVQIRAPMPGLVSNVLVTAGDTVERGQAVVVLEAMKMENDLSTPRAGIVTALRVTKGQTVNQGELLVVIGDTAGAPATHEADANGDGVVS